MAGFYPDVPDNRMAYDVDGSRVVGLTTQGTILEFSQLQAEGLQNENTEQVHNGSTTQPGRSMVAVIFPELRNLSGWVYYENYDDSRPSGTRRVQVSADTTNGADGTWTTIHTYGSGDGGGAETNLARNVINGSQRVRELYRTQIRSASEVNVRGVRVGIEVATGRLDILRFAALHLYGSPSDTTDVDRLFFIETGSTNNVAPAFFDFGDVPRSSTATKTFRIRNASNSLTANSITLSRTVLFDGTPTVSGDFQFSSDGTTWSNTLSIGNLAPGTNSGTLHIRRSTAANAELGVWALRLHADASSWS